jgi:hypothetical protein
MDYRNRTERGSATIRFGGGPHPQVRALCLVGCVVFLAVSAKFLLPECQFPYMLYEIGYIYCLSVFRPA